MSYHEAKDLYPITIRVTITAIRCDGVGCGNQIVPVPKLKPDGANYATGHTTESRVIMQHAVLPSNWLTLSFPSGPGTIPNQLHLCPDCQTKLHSFIQPKVL